MIGRKLSNYHINERLGEGGMGTVYKATDLRLERTVAIKTLHPFLVNKEDSFKRFKNEAYLSARISHPNVATLYNFEKADDTHFIVMEYVEGKALDDVLKLQGSIPEAEAVKISLQVLEGLGAAHDLGIMHRDLKPANIMIDYRGFVKLMDFGIARLENTERMTRQNSVIGTLEYLAPELVKGAEPAKASDLYAVGVMLYEMLSGKTLFAGDSEAALMYNIAHKSPSLELKGTSRGLLQIIRKLTHKQIAKRYKNTEEAIRDLEKIHQNAKVNTLLLQQKLSTGKEKTASKAINLPTLPSLANTDWKKISLPFDMDLRILAAALVFCFLIVLFNLFRDTPNTEKIPSQSLAEQQEKADDQRQLAGSSVSNNFGTMESEKEGITFLEKFDEGSKSPTQKSEGKAEGSLREESGKKSTPTKRENRSGSTEQGKTKTNRQIEKRQEENSDKPEQKVKNPSSSAEEKITEREEEKVQEERAPSSPPVAKESQKPKRSVKLRIPDMYLAASFAERVSTETHQEGQYVYLQTQSPLYQGSHLIIAKGSRIKAQIKKLKRAIGKKKAFLAIQLLSVQAVNGRWLAVSYPEYSNLSKGSVVFQQGQQINKVKLKSTNLTLNY